MQIYFTKSAAARKSQLFSPSSWGVPSYFCFKISKIDYLKYHTKLELMEAFSNNKLYLCTLSILFNDTIQWNNSNMNAV